MYEKYPKFLKKNPMVMGLDFIDLALIGIGLALSKTFQMNPLFAIGITGGLILLHKIADRYLDFTGFILGISKKKELMWIDVVRGIRE